MILTHPYFGVLTRPNWVNEFIYTKAIGCCFWLQATQNSFSYISILFEH